MEWLAAALERAGQQVGDKLSRMKLNLDKGAGFGFMLKNHAG